MTTATEEEDRVARQAHWAEYRKQMQVAEQKSQEDFDKTVLSLSAGALGISFVFLKDVIGPNPVLLPHMLFAAWVCWGLSSFSVLASYFLSHMALRHTIRQIDNDTLHKEVPSGPYRKPLVFLNGAGAVLFVVGIIAITAFANANLKTKGVPDGNSKTTTTTTTATGAASTPASSPSAAPAATTASGTPGK
jgi:hypothetical protein